MSSPYLVVAKAVRELDSRSKADVTCNLAQQHTEFTHSTEDSRDASLFASRNPSRAELLGSNPLQDIALHTAPEEMPFNNKFDNRRLSEASFNEGETDLHGISSGFTSHCGSVSSSLATDSALHAFKVASGDQGSSCNFAVSSPTLSSRFSSTAIGGHQAESECPPDASCGLGSDSVLSSGHCGSSERLAASRSGTARSLSFTHIPLTPSTRFSDYSAAPTPRFTASRPCGQHAAAVAGSTSVPCSVSWQAVAYGAGADTIFPRMASRRREEAGASLSELHMLRATRPLELHVKQARGPVVLNERTRQTELVSPTRPSPFRNWQREEQELAAATYGETKWLPPDRQTISSALRRRQPKQQPSAGYESFTEMRGPGEGWISLSTDDKPAASHRPLSLFRSQHS